MRNRSGFTAIEMALVTTIMGLVTAIAYPRLASVRDRGALESARRHVITQLAGARASAIQRGQAVRLRTPDGKELACVQIAGLIARRILCDLRPDQDIRAGERIGMIRFGSRVDLYLPQGVTPLAVPGQIAVAGETVFADLTRNEPAWQGEVR